MLFWMDINKSEIKQINGYLLENIPKTKHYKKLSKMYIIALKVYKLIYLLECYNIFAPSIS